MPENMEDEDARELLLDAGVPEDRIDRQAIIIASVVGDLMIKMFAKKVAERLLKEPSQTLPNPPLQSRS